MRGLVLVLLLSGCATVTRPVDTIRLDRVEVALAIGDFHALAAVLKAKTAERCADTAPPAMRFSSQSCATITEGLGQAANLRVKLIEALRNPRVEIDWAEIARIVELLVTIALKFV